MANISSKIDDTFLLATAISTVPCADMASEHGKNLHLSLAINTESWLSVIKIGYVFMVSHDMYPYICNFFLIFPRIRPLMLPSFFPSNY